MIHPPISLETRKRLARTFGKQAAFDQPLAKYTSARIGGPADVVLTAPSAEKLAEMVLLVWEEELPYLLIGGGSNMLVSDQGVRGVVILNRARRVEFDLLTPSVTADSGSNFGAVARQAGRKGFTGMEWAAGIPGTVGGAVVGNAGAHGGDTAGNLILAEVLHHTKGRQSLTVQDLAYGYRTSILKTKSEFAVVLSATFSLSPGEPEVIRARMDELVEFRKRTQPLGASMGSMFKNPPGDYAGRLIEAAGLKGTRIGDAQISEMHANFFINHGAASGADVFGLISTARQKVEEKFGVRLELEIELVGEWDE
ncbi:MAG: UDP-N-acetylmuramate dehydrogenase [Anaerolineales bacterium]|nr:UDP-N-acetylmuramate dehydrogenase [Anaerolineales bacterium]